MIFFSGGMGAAQKNEYPLMSRCECGMTLLSAALRLLPDRHGSGSSFGPWSVLEYQNLGAFWRAVLHSNQFMRKWKYVTQGEVNATVAKWLFCCLGNPSVFYGY